MIDENIRCRGHLGHLEFAIIAPASDMAGALRIVERLQEAIDASPLMFAGEFRQLKVRAAYSAVSDLRIRPWMQ